MAVDTLLAACELFGREAEVLLEHPDIAARYTECVPEIAREPEHDFTFPGVCRAWRGIAFPPGSRRHCLTSKGDSHGCSRCDEVEPDRQ